MTNINNYLTSIKIIYTDPDLDLDPDFDHDHDLDLDHDPDHDLDHDHDPDLDPDLDPDFDLYFCFSPLISFLFYGMIRLMTFGYTTHLIRIVYP